MPAAILEQIVSIFQLVVHLRNSVHFLLILRFYNLLFYDIYGNVCYNISASRVLRISRSNYCNITAT